MAQIARNLRRGGGGTPWSWHRKRCLPALRRFVNSTNVTIYGIDNFKNSTILRMGTMHSYVILFGVSLLIGIGCQSSNQQAGLGKASGGNVRANYSVSGCQSIGDGSSLNLCYILDGRSYGRVPGSTKDARLFLILWKSHSHGKVGLDRENQTFRVNDHFINPSLNKQAIYILQSDYNLQELPLTGPEVTNCLNKFSLVAQGLVTNELWYDKIVPKLQLVD